MRLTISGPKRHTGRTEAGEERNQDQVLGGSRRAAPALLLSSRRTLQCFGGRDPGNELRFFRLHSKTRRPQGSPWQGDHGLCHQGSRIQVVEHSKVDRS